MIAGEIVAQPAAATRRRLAATRKSLDDVTVLKGDPAQDRPLLVQMPIGRGAHGAAVQRLRAAAKSLAGAPAGGAAAGDRQARQIADQKDAWRRQMPAATRAVLDTIDYAKLMVASGEYDHAVPNFRLQAAQTRTMSPFPPNDRDYVKQRWHYEAINLPGAVAALQGIDLSASPAPIVAAVDSGIVGNHPDLANQLVAGYDFVSEPVNAGDGGGVDVDPDDAALEPGFSFHGSHVAGTIAAQTYNGIGGAGVAPIARGMQVRVVGTIGSGRLYHIIQGVRFAAGLPTDAGIAPQRRADVINLSLGASGIACDDAMFRDVFNQVRARGVLVVAAAGNDSRGGTLMPVSFPANCPSVFSVGATDAGNRRAPYSNVGPENFVAAPGGDTSRSSTGNGLPDGIYSTMASIDGDGRRLPTYGYLQGTSMAAPHVAGVLALMRWVDPALTPQAIEELVRSGAIVDDLGDTGRDPAFGYGLVNARKAVDAALARRGGDSPQPPAAAGRTEAQPSAISLGSIRTDAELSIAHVGGSDEVVVSVASDSPLISVAPKGAGAVDPATGLGTYRILAHRESMALGSSAFPNLVIQLAPARTITVPVAIERRAAAAGQGNLGPVYVVVLDAADPDRKVVADAVVAAPVDGRYAYTVTVPGTGSISVIAGSDIDNNGAICSAGEACGGYPMLAGKLEVLQPGGNLDGIDFSLGPYGGISPDASLMRR
jgi:serine protease